MKIDISAITPENENETVIAYAKHKLAEAGHGDIEVSWGYIGNCDSRCDDRRWMVFISDSPLYRRVYGCEEQVTRIPAGMYSGFDTENRLNIFEAIDRFCERVLPTANRYRWPKGHPNHVSY